MRYLIILLFMCFLGAAERHSLEERMSGWSVCPAVNLTKEQEETRLKASELAYEAFKADKATITFLACVDPCQKKLEELRRSGDKNEWVAPAIEALEKKIVKQKALAEEQKKIAAQKRAEAEALLTGAGIAHDPLVSYLPATLSFTAVPKDFAPTPKPVVADARLDKMTQAKQLMDDAAEDMRTYMKFQILLEPIRINPSNDLPVGADFGPEWVSGKPECIERSRRVTALISMQNTFSLSARGRRLAANQLFAEPAPQE